jgi:hypothetical protein
MQEFQMTYVFGKVTCEPYQLYCPSGRWRYNFSVTVNKEMTGSLKAENKKTTTYLSEAYNEFGYRISKALRLNDYVFLRGRIIDYGSALNSNEFGLAVYKYSFLPFELFESVMLNV